MILPDEPEALLALVDELCKQASPGPWFYNSYSGIYSAPINKEYDRLESLLSDDAPDEAWEQLPEPLVAYVPTSHGDMATAQGIRDAQFIVQARELLPKLAEIIRNGNKTNRNQG